MSTSSNPSLEASRELYPHQFGPIERGLRALRGLKSDPGFIEYSDKFREHMRECLKKIAELFPSNHTNRHNGRHDVVNALDKMGQATTHLITMARQREDVIGDLEKILTAEELWRNMRDKSLRRVKDMENRVNEGSSKLQGDEHEPYRKYIMAKTRKQKTAEKIATFTNALEMRHEWNRDGLMQELEAYKKDAKEAKAQLPGEHHEFYRQHKSHESLLLRASAYHEYTAARHKWENNRRPSSRGQDQQEVHKGKGKQREEEEERPEKGVPEMGLYLKAAEESDMNVARAVEEFHSAQEDLIKNLERVVLLHDLVESLKKVQDMLFVTKANGTVKFKNTGAEAIGEIEGCIEAWMWCSTSTERKQILENQTWAHLRPEGTDPATWEKEKEEWREMCAMMYADQNMGIILVAMKSAGMDPSWGRLGHAFNKHA